MALPVKMFIQLLREDSKVLTCFMFSDIPGQS